MRSFGNLEHVKIHDQLNESNLYWTVVHSGNKSKKFHLALLSVIPFERSARRSPLSPSVGGRHAWLSFMVIVSSMK
jgi:hypothetical protein